MKRNTKSEFLRGVLLYNPHVHSQSDKQREVSRIAAKIIEYEAKHGGTWNYENLYDVLKKVLKGMPKHQAVAYLASMEGQGEAKAKTALFNFMYEKLNFKDAQYIDVGPNVIKIDANREVSIQPDFGFKRLGKNYHVIVYPNGDPVLKRIQKDAIAAIFARPIPLTIEEYTLCLVEYPRLDERRNASLETFEFQYRELDGEFLEHLAIYYHELENSDGQGNLFEF